MDRDLVEAAQHGDESAFVDLIRPRAQRLLALVRRIVGDRELAEDVLQDALVLAWRDLRGLRDPDRFDAWLHRLIVNLSVRRASRERRRTHGLRVLTIDAPAPRDEIQAVALRDQLERGFAAPVPDAAGRAGAAPPHGALGP